MPQDRKKIGRPRSEEGHDYLLQNVPQEDWDRFASYCEAQGWDYRYALLFFIKVFPSIGRDELERLIKAA